MAPTILIVGATGNTGRSVVSTLADLIQNPDSPVASYHLIAQTRSASGEAAKQLSTLPNVSILELPWLDITSDWLRKNDVNKVFVASHAGPSAFSEESHFLVAALNAGVKQVVRISTIAANVRPDSQAYYPRIHWAIETMLDTDEFKGMMWTSLQPNIFMGFVLPNPVALVQEYRKTGKQQPLSLFLPKDAGVGIIDSNDVGAFAAHVLASDHPELHNKKRYVLNGPEDISGQEIVDLVEKEIGTKVENVIYNDIVLILTINHAVATVWKGVCGIDTTSKEVFEIRAPKTTVAQAFKDCLEE
ncbi:hypothetical protein DL95DRAFT_426364 [Leptodontidium sp. 2 PMI_412]|nr:hypothetical protein DL95DRAFT_426364 [Leptodontidium sp. 2 PMI_412]